MLWTTHADHFTGSALRERTDSKEIDEDYEKNTGLLIADEFFSVI